MYVIKFLLLIYSVKLTNCILFAQWIPELQKYCPGVPYLLVGTRIDLRNDQKTLENLSREGKTPISMGQGEKMAKELQAVKYVECSALTKVSNYKYNMCTNTSLLLLKLF